jgi:hypothetical protein
MVLDIGSVQGGSDLVTGLELGGENNNFIQVGITFYVTHSLSKKRGIAAGARVRPLRFKENSILTHLV